MTKYARLSDIEARDGVGAASITPDSAPSGDGNFSQGLRSSMTGAGGQLRAFAGGIGEAAGATDFAKAQYAKAAEAAQLAQQQAPEINDWRQVTSAPDFSTGLRRAGGYIAGLAGQALPMVGLGLGAGAATAMTGGGALAGLAAGTAAVAPFEMGGALQRQQADPEALKRSAGDRLGTAALEGTGRALAMNAVPQLMGGKLLGSGLGAASKAGILAEGVGGNALAGAAAEKISSLAQDHLDPNRDTSGDDTRMLDAAVSGGALGLPFAGAGLVGHALHGKGAPRPAGTDIETGAPVPAETAPRPSLAQRIIGGFTKDAGQDAAEKIAAGKDVIDPAGVEALKNAPPEQQAQMVDAIDAKRAETVKGWFQELTQDGKLSDENKAALHAAATDFTDRANQAAIAGIKLARDGGKKAMDMATEFYDAVAPKKAEGKSAEPMPLKSEVSAGADKAIADVITPHVAKNFPALAQDPESLQRVTVGLRRVMDVMQKTGSVDPEVASHLQKMFGKDTANVLTQLHEQVLDYRDKPATENYFRAVNKLDTSVDARTKLIDMMRDAYQNTKGKDANPSPDELHQMSKYVDEYVSGALMGDKTPEQRIAHSRMIEGGLREHFGDKTDDILETARTRMELDRAQEEHALDAKKSGTSEEEFSPDDIEYAPADDDGLAYHEDAGVTVGAGTRKIYYNADKKAEGASFMLSDAAHRQQHGTDKTAHARVLQQMQAEHPDMTVRTVSARQYAREHLIPDEQLHAMTKGDPDNHVAVMAEDANTGALSRRDVERLKLDTHNYSDSKSRIDIRSGDKENIKLDAIKLTKMFAQEHMLPRYEHDINPMHRLGRQFATGLAALADHLGTDEAFHVPDTTVIAYRDGGKPITWGEVQKEGRIKPDAELQSASADGLVREKAVKGTQIPELRKQRIEALNAEDIDKVVALTKQIRDIEQSHPVISEIDAVHDQHVVEATDPQDVLADAPNARPGAEKMDKTIRDDYAARRNIPELAKRLGESRKVIEEGIAKHGPLRIDAKELRRQAGMTENWIEEMRGDQAKAKQKDPMHGEEMDALAKRAEAMRQAADVMDKSGRVGLSFKERKAVRDYLKTEKEYNEAMRDINRRRESSFSFDKADRGQREANPSGNVHAAVREHGEEDLGGVFAASRNMEAGPENNMLHADNFFYPPKPNKPGEHVANFDGRLQTSTISAIDSKLNRLENMKTAGGMAQNRIAMGVAAKGRELQARLGSMRTMDQGLLASIVKDKSLSSVAETINELHAKYKDVAPDKPVPFVERVLKGGSDYKKAVEQIRTSNDTKGVQRAVDALLPHQKNVFAARVLEVANERLGKSIEKDPGVAYSLQQVDPHAASTSKVQSDVRAHIEKVLGKTVDVEFAKMLHAGEFYTDKARTARGLNADVIRISTHSLDPMSVGYHESLHAFFAKLHDDGLMDAAHPLEKAASGEHVLKQLRTLLANEPEALAQLSNPHERAAYMYQFWAADKLQLKGKPAGILGHIAEFFKKALGIWTNDARAEHIMEYFHSGEYAKNMRDRSAVGRVLAEGTNAHVDKFMAMVKPLAKLSLASAVTGDARLRGTNIPALVALADKVYAPLYGEHGSDPGYVPAARNKRGEILNKLATSLAGHDPALITDAMEAMQRGEKGSTPKEREVVRTIRKMLDDTFDYMQDAKVRVNDLGYGKDYFPRVWDPQTILARKDEFRAMLEKYKAQGKFNGSVDQVIATLARTDGADLQVETVKPGMQSSKQRVLAFISGQDAAPFVNKNLYQTLNSYVTQATRRAEWARRFEDDGSVLHGMLHDAQQQGATKEHLQLASDYLQGVDGTLGDHIDPKLRRAYGNMIVYQNVRLLPLALFSSLIDPMGILVRGGTVGDTFHAMKRGFAEIPKGFKKNAEHDHWTDLSAQLGVIDNAVLMHTIGSSYTQGMTGNFARKVNDTLFKYNLMEQFNTSMRVAATRAAVGFLGRHADGTASTHSPRFLAELGFKPGEIIVKNGEPLITQAQFESHGLSPEKAQAAADRMTLAVNKWVDGAILRPNAAHKPIWMNDPRFALIAHLKPFVYSFQETILKRVANEVKFGNLGPAYSLAAYVPFMLAADTMKGMIQGGGEQPDWKKGWDASDYLFYEVQRAGLFGVGQFGVDMAKDLHRGGLGIGALTGPSVEQLGEAVKTAAGPEQFKTFAMNAMPANALFDAAGAATASTNAID